MRPVRTGITLMATAAAFGIGVASVAWACTAAPVFVGSDPPSGPSGTPVDLRGEGIAATPGAGPVEIRWNALDGPLLATTQAVEGRFSTLVTIPTSSPGVHTLLAVTSGSAVARTPFDVTTPGGKGALEAVSTPERLWSPGRPGAVSSSGNAMEVSFFAGVTLLSVGLAACSAVASTVLLRRRTAVASRRGLR